MEVRGEPRRSDATNSTISGVQSIGSSELTRNSTSSTMSPIACSKLEKARGWSQIAAIRAEVDSGDRDLPEPGRDGPFDFLQNLRTRGAPARAARRRNDAVAARLVAAGLNAQRPGGAPGDARRDRRAARSIAQGQARERDEPILVVVADDVQDVGQRRHVVCDIAWRSSRSRRSCVRDSSRATRRIVWRAPWSADAVTEQVLTMTRSAASGEAGLSPSDRELLFQLQRVRLVDSTAEGDDCVLHCSCEL